MKNKYIILLFISVLLLAISCKPDYIAPTFPENRVKYVIAIDTVFDNGVIIDTTEFIYDDLYRIDKIIKKSSQNQRAYKLLDFEYKKDYIIQKEYSYYIEENKFYLYQEIKYYLDNYGNIIRYIVFDDKNKIKYYIDLEYNNENNILSFYKNDTLIEEYEYNNHNKLTSIYNFEKNSEKNIIYNLNKNNLTFYFYDYVLSSRLYFVDNYILFANKSLKNTIKEIPINTYTKSINFNYEYNSDSLINFIQIKLLFDTSYYSNSKDTTYKITEMNFYKSIKYY